MTDTDGAIPHLKKHGPTPVPDLPVPNVRPEHKSEGLAVFKLKKTVGPGVPIGGRTTNVAYLMGRHSEEEVVESWVEANPEAVETESRRRSLSIRIGSHGDDWRDAFRSIRRRIEEADEDES